MIKAIDFTKKGDEDNILILHNDGKTIQVKKKFVEPTELFEIGVYNSEMDVIANPKTDENKPDAVGVINRLSERLKEITHSLEEMRLFVKDNSSLSHDSLDKCINELSSYLKSLDEEVKNGSSAIIN